MPPQTPRPQDVEKVEDVNLSPLLDRVGRRLGSAAAHAEFEAWAQQQQTERLQAELDETRRLLERAQARIAELEDPEG